MQITLQLGQAPTIDFALEVDHVFQWNPVVVPTPGVELRMIGRPQRHATVAAGQSEQIPDLLLAAIAAAPLAFDPMLRDLVAQPISSASEYLDVRRIESDFFLQFPIHRLLGRLADVNAALRKLPRVLSDPLAPEDPIFRVGDDNGDVRAITVTVQHRDTCISARWLNSCTDRDACKGPHQRPYARRPPRICVARCEIRGWFPPIFDRSGPRTALPMRRSGR